MKHFQQRRPFPDKYSVWQICYKYVTNINEKFSARTTIPWQIFSMTNILQICDKYKWQIFSKDDHSLTATTSSFPTPHLRRHQQDSHRAFLKRKTRFFSLTKSFNPGFKPTPIFFRNIYYEPPGRPLQCEATGNSALVNCPWEGGGGTNKLSRISSDSWLFMRSKISPESCSRL